MLHRTINQFLTEVYFGDLDILLLDLPPGTGDVAISVGQLLPHPRGRAGRPQPRVEEAHHGLRRLFTAPDCMV